MHIINSCIFNFSYTINDLSSEKMFVVNVDISVCFEEKDCLIDVPLLNDVYLPKPLCNWNSGYNIKGLSVTGPSQGLFLLYNTHDKIILSLRKKNVLGRIAGGQ